MKRHIRIRTLGLAVAAAIGTASLPLAAQATSVDDCRGLVGFNAAGITGGAAAVVSAQGDLGAFLSRNRTFCTVKYVQPSAKAKPQTVQVTLDGNTATDVLDPMAADECSMYASLSSIDSKLGQAKLADAYSVSSSLNAKVDDLRATGKLSESGWQAIKPATAAITACVTTLINQP
jgi:hypothetical protein